MRRRAIVLCLAAAVAASPAGAQPPDDPMQRLFLEAAQRMQAGNLDEAERVLREMLKRTDSPRVKLELARTLFLQGRYKEAKVLFDDVSTRSDTPWRVRDNIAHFVRVIEERTGYVKLGLTVVSDTNPRNLAEQKEFSIGSFRVTPTDAPETVTGLRYAARGWMPLGAKFRGGAYVNGSFTDYPGHELDRITADVGGIRNLSDTGRVRGKAGMELGTFGGKLLYRFPYVGLDAVIKETGSWRVAGEMKAGRVDVPDFDYLDARYLSTGASARRTVSENAVVSMSGTIERSSAKERPYSYYGWDLGPGIDMFWPDSTFVTGARVSLGARRYAATDPLFGERRADAKLRLDVSVGNKRWRWGNSTVSLVASVERNRSNIAFYSYRKLNVSVVIE